MLEPEDRDVFYTMEDLGILETEREEPWYIKEERGEI